MPAFPRIGLVVNPIAGMGGRVGLKGTDGLADRARALGAKSTAPARATSALAPLAGRGHHFLTAGGEMGEASLAAAGLNGYECVYRSGPVTTADDTRAACRAFTDRGVDLIVFCGGDGTARDVADAVGTTTPILGIPAGVKMYSSVFAVDPAAAARILLADGPRRLSDGEVIDVDEGAYRDNDLRTVLHAVVRTTTVPGLVQPTKQVFEEADEDRARAGIGAFIADAMRPGVLYILGPGTTTGAVAARLGLDATLLGFDAVLDGELVGADLAEADLIALLEAFPDARLVLSVIGAQGFVIGRGTQVCTPEVLKRIGMDHLIVIGTPAKLQRTPRLHLDTGDPDLDAAVGRHLQVVTGYGTAQRKRVGPESYV